MDTPQAASIRASQAPHTTSQDRTPAARTAPRLHAHDAAAIRGKRLPEPLRERTGASEQTFRVLVSQIEALKRQDKLDLGAMLCLFDGLKTWREDLISGQEGADQVLGKLRSLINRIGSDIERGKLDLSALPLADRAAIGNGLGALLREGKLALPGMARGSGSLDRSLQILSEHLLAGLERENAWDEARQCGEELSTKHRSYNRALKQFNDLREDWPRQPAALFKSLHALIAATEARKDDRYDEKTESGTKDRLNGNHRILTRLYQEMQQRLAGLPDWQAHRQAIDAAAAVPAMASADKRS